MKNWKVETTRVFGLEDSLNSLSKQGYEIYSINTQNHVEFRIIAWKDTIDDLGKEKTVFENLHKQLEDVSIVKVGQESPEISKHKIDFHPNSNEQKICDKEIIEPTPKGFENKKGKRKKNK